MRRRQLLLLGWLQLCRARQPGFSVHRDLLSYPQFEVVFSESYISEPDAQILIDSADPSHPSYEAEFAGQTDLSSSIGSARDGTDADTDATDADADGRAGRRLTESYEIMSMPPYRYLCAIPIIEPPPTPNKTAAELAKAEEARELARASAHGWELVGGLEGSCLYYMSGWWSYRFCYGQDIVQFHALPASVKSGPPQRDANTAEYRLGRLPGPHVAARGSRRGEANQRDGQDGQSGQSAASPPNTELQVKGDQRYLVQRMADGTICDLTGRERTIEVQYHCSPGSTQDRIGWIKEVTTCAYLMMVHTPRLCVDVAFQPPKEERANIISCRAIVSDAEQAQWHAQKTLEAQAAMVGQASEAAQAPITIGGVVVGGRQMLGKGEDGKDPPRLAPPRGFRSTNNNPPLAVEIIAEGSSKEEGSRVDTLTVEELEELGLSPEMVEDLLEELQKRAGDRGWQLEVVDLPADHREIRGFVDDDDGEESEGGSGEDGGKGGDGADGGEGADGSEQGSEEQFFKEEL
ncbi:glucosidase II beta subunit-like protein-domain-containing protein [Xylariaceae sp. FL0804]|nr:glucosidase II beta subunit-like protein-domain-containing protein [Xylariaceae sp. FL0804]